MTRSEVLNQLLDRLYTVEPTRPALIAIDGFDGAGKTVLAHELVLLNETIRAHRPVISISIDGFHYPRERRHAAGKGPESFYYDSYDYASFHQCVVEPLRKSLPITPAVWDVARDEPVTNDPIDVFPNALVLVDGIFLQRPELRDVWDASVWVDVPFTISVPRGNARFPGTHDSNPDSPANHRYVGGQRLYLAESEPRKFVTWIIDNTDLENPSLVRNSHD